MRISEVSEQCSVSADTLRYYERIGLLPPVNRSESGIRNYSDLDVQASRVYQVHADRGASCRSVDQVFRPGSAG